MEKMAKRINLIHYVLYCLSVILAMYGLQYFRDNPGKLPIETGNYFSETNKIKNRIEAFVEADCIEGGEWYCGIDEIGVKNIKATKNQSFATGVGATKEGVEFNWIAIKDDGKWNDVIMARTEEKVNCVKVPPRIVKVFFTNPSDICLDQSY